MEKNQITIEEILKISGEHYMNNIVLHTNKELICKGNTFAIERNTLIVIGKMINNLHVVREVQKLLEKEPNIKIVIWNKAETLTETAQITLKEILSETYINKLFISIKCIFITNNIDVISTPLLMRCLLIED